MPKIISFRLYTVILLLSASLFQSPSFAQEQQKSGQDLVIQQLQRQLSEMKERQDQTEAELTLLRNQQSLTRSALDQELDNFNTSVEDTLPPAVEDVNPSQTNPDTLDEYEYYSWPDVLSEEDKEQLSWNKIGGWRIVPFGKLRGEMIYSAEPQTADAIVIFLNPKSLGVDEDQSTVHAKTSQINFDITGPEFNGWQTGGKIITNFLGQAPLRNQSGLNIINAFGEAKNENWRFAFGRMLDLFGPIAPNTVNGISQRGAGNIGIYRGAIHLDRYVTISDSRKWTFSARASQQNISDYQLIPSVRGKDAGWPNLETRIGLELGSVKNYGRPFEVGVSAVFGEVQAVADQLIYEGIVFPAEDETAQTRGIALDLQLKGETFGIRGEAWWGQAAGTYFVATLQSLNPNTAQAIASKGGWAEIYCNLKPNLTMHLGYGVDDPNNSHLGYIDPNVNVGQISFNEVAWGNMMWNVTEYFELAFEVSHRRTKYLAEDAANQGMLYHFASTLKF